MRIEMLGKKTVPNEFVVQTYRDPDAGLKSWRSGRSQRRRLFDANVLTASHLTDRPTPDEVGRSSAMACPKLFKLDDNTS